MKKKVVFVLMVVVITVLGLSSFALAQDGTDWLGSFALVFGLDIAQIAAMSATIVFLLNFVKGLFGLNGKAQILIVAFLACLAMSIFKSYPDIVKILGSTIVLFVVSVGGWISVKIIAHKMAEPPEK